MSDEYDDSVQSLAEQLAARGYDALVDQLRSSFAQAAAAHADIVSFDGDKLEAVVQNFVPRADGLQWRRALAAVAAEQLGIDVTEALNHPAVVLAQEMIGAPSYEESLAELVSRTAWTGQLALNAGSSDTWQDEAESPAAQDEAEVEPSTAPADSSDEPGGSWLDAAADAGHGGAAYGSYSGETAYDAVDAPAFGSEASAFAPDRVGPDGEPILDGGAPASDDTEPSTGGSGQDGVADPEHEEVEHAPYAAAVQERDPWAPVAPDSVEPTASDATAADEADATADDLDEHSSAYSTRAATSGPLTYAASGSPATEVDDEEELPTPNYSAGSRLPETTAPVAPAPATSVATTEQLRVAAIHLGGVANLTTHRQPVGLRLWEPGLDIVRADDEIIGRLGWEDIESLEVPAPRGLLRRRAPTHAQLVVRTESGDASFEIPELTPEELRARVQTLIDRFSRR